MLEKEMNGCVTKRKCCIDVIVFVLSILLAFALGVIIGSVTGILALLGLGSFIVLSVVLAILLLIRIITLICNKQKC